MISPLVFFLATVLDGHNGGPSGIVIFPMTESEYVRGGRQRTFVPFLVFEYLDTSWASSKMPTGQDDSAMEEHPFGLLTSKSLERGTNVVFCATMSNLLR